MNADLASCLRSARRLTNAVGVLCISATILSVLAACLSGSPHTGSGVTPTPDPAWALSGGHVPKGVTWQVNGQFRSDGSANWQVITRDLVDMQGAGINWVRVAISQDGSDGSMSQFVQLTQLSQKYGVNLMPDVYQTFPPNDIGSQGQRHRWQAWLGSVVTALHTSAHFWEIDNEENRSWIDSHSSTVGDSMLDDAVTRFADHMQDSITAIKGADPEAKVIWGGLSESQSERYIDSMIRTGAYRSMDYMGFHPYAGNADRVVNRLDMLKAKMAAVPGWANTPIWVTEIGFHTQSSWTNNPGYTPTEAAKARAIVDTVKALRGAGTALPIFVYTLHDGIGRSGYGLTILDASGSDTHLPAYDAYKALWAGETLSVRGP